MSRMSVVVAPLVTAIILLGSSASDAQLIDTSNLLPGPTLVNGVLTFGNTVIQTDDAATQEELPGLGHKFELFGSMDKDTDPQNPIGGSGHSGGGVGGNETISANITLGGPLAFAYRKLGGIKLQSLTNQIGLKYLFVGRTCGAGSPRVVLLVDADGDGDTDFSANGHVNAPTTTGCVAGRWTYEDFTDLGFRWEITPGNFVPTLPNRFPYFTWDELLAGVNAVFPNHQVPAGFLLDGESCNFGVTAACGKAYYDLFTLENRTLEIWQDAVKK